MRDGPPFRTNASFSCMVNSEHTMNIMSSLSLLITLLLLNVTCSSALAPSIAVAGTQRVSTHCSSRRCTDETVGPFPRSMHTQTSTTLYENSLSNAFSKLFGGSQPEQPAPKRLFEIPVQEMKIGGLRFVLGLHLMGQQNTPEKGSWKVNQANDGILDMFYRDETGSIAISFLDDEKKIVVDRWGTQPSLQYQLQESLVLHSLLDELHTLAFENSEEVKEDNRLLKLKEPGDAIQKARATLPARKV